MGLHLISGHMPAVLATVLVTVGQALLVLGMEVVGGGRGREMDRVALAVVLVAVVRGGKVGRMEEGWERWWRGFLAREVGRALGWD